MSQILERAIAEKGQSFVLKKLENDRLSDGIELNL
jgi:hypothetical protein